ncbi:hypothetical protein GCM10010329_05560 [Streptomyces spiroverticillatus]|uniref:Uncharacterized protein n=1 Tax=Streptomyces finlayi TaxID=67296 RepID=A0A918WST6_9ACTN|nr:hypothetical protein [Streptomyces finlayi]GGZ88343.1 hypothetical protein GCM10010329_05560 [Streptomyces spiroverticillatus]GHC79368.1 hypothetical protein GCM10010334_05540 [Streptomyces finlayi]
MLRHDFQPGRAVLGLTFLGAVAVYAADVEGEWDTPWWALIPLVACGLLVASVVGAVSYGIRRRRRSRIASSENTDAPASTSGSHPIR